MKRIVTLFLSLILLLSCLCAPASALFDPSLFYEVQARSAYIVNTDTNIIVYDKDSSRQVPAGGLTKYDHRAAADELRRPARQHLPDALRHLGLRPQQ